MSDKTLEISEDGASVSITETKTITTELSVDEIKTEIETIESNIVIYQNRLEELNSLLSEIEASKT